MRALWKSDPYKGYSNHRCHADFGLMQHQRHDLSFGTVDRGAGACHYGRSSN